MNERDRGPLTIVAIDDDPASLHLVSEAIAREDFTILTESDPFAGLELVSKHRPQIVLLDLFMPNTSGMEILEKILQIDPGVDVLLVTAHYSTDAAVEAIKKGASDYITKPFDISALQQRVFQVADDVLKRRQTLSLDLELVKSYEFEGIIGRSPLMLEVFSRIRRIAPHFRTVLITGPTGSGKELVARALHRLSPAVENPYVACNCSAFVESLLESELFGHVSGAFTGAQRDKAGLFEYADGGVLFMDEVGDMPPSTQAKVLRVLQNQEIQRVGSPAVRRVNVRVVAATNRDLTKMVSEGTFRDDLYYRLSPVEITLPSLSGRKEDLPLLQRHFLDRFAAQYGKPMRGMTRRAQTVLAKYHWPGNVRELENAIAHSCMMAQNEIIDVADLPERLQRPIANDHDEMVSLDEIQRRHVMRILELTGNNKVRTAEILGISRATLYRLLGASPKLQGDLLAQ